ncbi:MAG: SGNH/GDSL hydrolase family protein [Planctomycetes bacterium]|nr:SGNH/GDSL hydrolase family protein [Planctomycetota bacterium]
MCKNGRLTTNRWGLRGGEPPQEWEAWDTWVTIGGSTTPCVYLDDEKTWPHLIQQRLRERNPRPWVGNGGIHGQTTRAHLVFVGRVVRAIRPDAVGCFLGVDDFSPRKEESRIDFGYKSRKRL